MLIDVLKESKKVRRFSAVTNILVEKEENKGDCITLHLAISMLADGPSMHKSKARVFFLYSYLEFPIYMN